MSIKLKFTVSFTIIAVLVAGMAIFIVNGIGKMDLQAIERWQKMLY